MQQQESRALELVAAALSEEYGVRVVSAGLRAFTKRDANNMPVITIPAIPLENANYRLLVRGYVDHEVGHVRFGGAAEIDQAILAQPEISGSFKAIISIYEDLRIDRMMGDCFIGCGRNLRKLALLLYGDPAIPDAASIVKKFEDGSLSGREFPWQIWQAALQYILYFGRSLSLQQLSGFCDQWRSALAILAPGLPEQLDPVLARLSSEGDSCAACVNLARETVQVISDWLYGYWQPGQSQQGDACLKEIPWLLRNGGQARDLADMGALAAFSLDHLINDLVEETQPSLSYEWHRRGGETWRQRLMPLSDAECREALQAAAKMSAQMQALLQSHILNREGPFRQGKLHTRKLHKLFIGRDDIFQRNNERRELNTEIVCCIDMSGSMRFDDKAPVASRSLYAVVESLSHIQGLKFSVMGFFDNNMLEIHVSPAPVDNRMGIVPDGGTLCGAALRAAARIFSHAPRKRKIIIMITDGDANDPEFFQEAIEDLGKSGVEILGIGIHDNHILQYLPEDQCCVLNEINDLAERLLDMLRKRLGIRP